MRRHQPKPKEFRPIQRFGIALIGGMILGFGALTLMSGYLHYSNWWGAPMFAPFALVIGVLCFVVAFRRRTPREM